MTILVTGATGFLGAALVTELLRRRQTVRVLVRDPVRARARFGEAVSVVVGEINDPQRVQQAVDGVATIYHLVGRLYHPGDPPSLYHQTHVEGTRVLLEACRGQQRLKRIVHCSTTGVHGVTGPRPAAEDAPYAPTNPYELTKLESELLALKFQRDYALPLSVVRPGLVYGPGDLHLLGFFASIQKGLFRVIAGGKALLHPIFIDDMIAAFLKCAATPTAVGRCYSIAGEWPVTMLELATGIAHALGKELPAGSIPLWLANLASDIFALLPCLQGERAPLTRSRVQFLTHSRVYDCRRAQVELGFKAQVNLTDGLRRTTAWYYKQRYLSCRAVKPLASAMGIRGAFICGPRVGGYLTGENVQGRMRSVERMY